MFNFFRAQLQHDDITPLEVQQRLAQGERLYSTCSMCVNGKSTPKRTFPTVCSFRWGNYRAN
jgi:hypothetical protein